MNMSEVIGSIERMSEPAAVQITINRTHVCTEIHTLHNQLCKLYIGPTRFYLPLEREQYF